MTSVSERSTGYEGLLTSFEVKGEIRDIWLTVSPPPSLPYGWKLHLSAVQHSVPQLLRYVLPILLPGRVAFKIARSADVLAALNEGVYGATQVGKFMTVYPTSPAQCRELADLLVRATPGVAGPRIVTDRYLGGAVYTRFGIISARPERDRLGNVSRSGHDPRGRYTVPFSVPPGVEDIFRDWEAADAPASPRIGHLFGPGYLIVDQLSEHAKGNTYKGLDTNRLGQARYVFIKEGRAHCLSDHQGRDARGRLRHQYTMAQKTVGIEGVAAVTDLFYENDNAYLVQEFMPGQDLEHRLPIPYRDLSPPERRTLLTDLLQLCGLLRQLHARAIVHRDLSPRNIRIERPGRGLSLLDFELAYDLQDSDQLPFLQGTPGYVSPQQRAGAPPDVTDDVFSLGAVMLMTATGMDTQRILYGYTPETFVDRVLRLSGAPPSYCSLIARCLDFKPEQRPSLDEIQDRLESWSGGNRFTALPAEVQPYTSVELDELIREGLKWLATGPGIDPVSGLWYSPGLEETTLPNGSSVEPRFELFRSTSRGVAGIVYTVAKVRRAGYHHPALTQRVDLAVDWLLAHHPTVDDQLPGLHFGEAGVAVALAEAVRAGCIATGNWLEPYLREALRGPADWPDLTHGAAGQGLACLLCARSTGDDTYYAYARRYRDYLLATQAEAGDWPLPSGVPGMEKYSYTGFAHGAAGIVYFLVEYARQFTDAGADLAARRGGEWLLRHAEATARSESLVWPLTAEDTKRWHWWCHGGPGIALALMALHSLTKEAKYLRALHAALRIHPREVCYNNFSQCHGLSGLGEIYLDAYHHTGERDYLDRAERLVAKLSALVRTDRHGASWLVENPFRATADLMIGVSGVLHFLCRYRRLSTVPMGMPLTY